MEPVGMPPVLARHADKIDSTIIPPAGQYTYRTKLRNTGFLCAIFLSVTPISKRGDKKNGDESNRLLFDFLYKSLI
jgi:hypothetical protein